ncbi:hypothetical protein H0A36_21085 [Endozoicomonas sp. SM1973]|uniref:SPOR domain-containing protein n=1 Tax=Spartinivicinus marinus TaxID=2994442 RepID=A0A853I9R3_9GAMM|nr:hypothetical protein [Spartinivicinus marinus]MCX4026310.1 hypothetical protein [Spartinivicinus marinus]NYZ68512.1 hypothetical protein [Spartinivicinus marinus]
MVITNLIVAGYYWHQGNQTAPVKGASLSVKASSKVASLTLLAESELKPRQRPQNSPSTKNATGVNTATGNSITNKGEFCASIGPIAEAKILKQIEQRFLAIGIKPIRKKTQVNTEPDYWVYIKPLISRRSALRKLKELKAQGRDSFIITDGELKNGLSLGLFTKQSSALNLQNEMISAGYDVAVKVVERFKDETWLNFSPSELELIADQVWVGLANNYPFIEKRRIRCKDVASY